MSVQAHSRHACKQVSLLVNHVHDFGVDLSSHALLLRLEFTTLFTFVVDIFSLEIVNRSGFAEESEPISAGTNDTDHRN